MYTILFNHRAFRTEHNRDSESSETRLVTCVSFNIADEESILDSTSKLEFGLRCTRVRSTHVQPPSEAVTPTELRLLI